MLPARDEQEYSKFPAEDVAFVQDWLAWADDHVCPPLRTLSPYLIPPL